jgi:sugar diacid utilization regulator/putative methionine-R-sulfoxide reductase with GAF domain
MNANATADQIKSDRSAKTILVTAATGDTGRPTVKLPLERGHKVAGHELITRQHDPSTIASTAGPTEQLLRRLLVADTVNDIAQAAVDAARESLNADLSWCGIVAGDFLAMAAHTGIRTAEMMALWRLQVGLGVGGRVAKEGRTISVRDYRHDPRRVPVMKAMVDEEGLRGAVCAPLVSGTEILGVIYAGQRDARDWTRGELEALVQIGRDAGVCLSRIKERHREQEFAVAAHRAAAEAGRALEGASLTAASVIGTEDVGAGVEVLAHHLGMRVELLGPHRQLLRTVPSVADDAPMQLETSVGDDALGTLRVLGNRELATSELHLVAVAARIIGLQLMRLREGLLAEVRLYSELLDDLLDGRFEDLPRVRDRAALLGINLSTPRYVLCVGWHRGSSAQQAPGSGSLAPVESAIRGRFPESIFVRRSEEVVVLLSPGTAALGDVHTLLQAAIREIRPAGRGLAAGLGRLCIGLSDYADSYGEASLGLDVARRRAKPAELIAAADLGLYGLLVRGSGRGSLETMVERALGPLLEADAEGGSDYIRTLSAYLACDRHLERTAASLHVHANTVRYRIAKVQEKLGVNLHDVENRFLLELALRIQAALGEGESRW